MNKPLFDGSDESDNDLQLGTNEDYAKSYNNFRQKELFKKFTDRGYDISESESSSGSESSEEDEIQDPKFDQEFFKTLSSLKSRDPAIYDKNTRFFNDLKDGINGENDSEGKTQKKTKPVMLKDYERQIILERGGKFEDDSDDEVEEIKQRAFSPTQVEEEQLLKAEFKKVVNDAEDSEDGADFGGIFKKRDKTKAEVDMEEKDFAEWLSGKKDDIEDNVKEKLEPLKHYWSSKKLPQGERFLRDYILNKGYAATNFADIPTYDEIVGDTAPLSEDEEELEKQAEFEHKYNFRFEEPDAEFIQRYPRTIENTVRRTDDKRKLKRQEVKERKHQEKEQKMKELEIVREMKRKEIDDKIQKLKSVTGNEELGFKDEELEEDFDPEEHDRRMQEIFNEQYYQVDEGEDKPDCPSDIEELKIEDWDNYDPTHGNYGYSNETDLHCEDDDFNMDCEYDAAAAKEQLQKELIGNTLSRKSRKGRRNRFMEMIQTEKPAFNPEDEKTYEEYLDEYYKMDCEDIIGDIPCRFKYVETTPNDFGLTIEEILLAKNKELNQWASLKKAIQMRPEYVEKKEQRLYKLKAKNEDLKRKIFKSLYGECSDNEDETVETSVLHPAIDNTNITTNQTATCAIKVQKKKKRKAGNQTLQNNLASLKSDEVTETPAKKQKTDNSTSESLVESTVVADAEPSTANKKKRKRKNKKKTDSTAITETLKLEIKKSEQKTFKTQQTNKPTNPKNKQNPFNSNNKTNSSLIGSLPQLRKNKGGKTKFNKHTNIKGSIQTGKDTKISDERLKAYGINPKKFHKNQKYGNKQD